MYNGFYRLAGVGIAAAILTAISFFAIHHMNSPTLYEGDRIEQRSCRQCGGKGKDSELALQAPELGDSCPFCHGTGKVEVILPGPNRPTTVRGMVVAASKLDPMDSYSTLKPQVSTEGSIGFDSHPGAIGGAKLQFISNDGKTIEDTSGSNGLFEVDLPPGSYSVLVRADGYQDFTSQIIILKLTAPIWMEKANMAREPSGGPEDVSEGGLRYVAALVKAGETGARMFRSD